MSLPIINAILVVNMHMSYEFLTWPQAVRTVIYWRI